VRSRPIFLTAALTATPVVAQQFTAADIGGRKNENATSSFVLVGPNFYPDRMAGMVLWVTA
jgi:hypothetical protein